MGCPRSHLVAVAFKDKIYAIGGVPMDSDDPSTTVEIFSLFRKTWKYGANLNVARYRPGACVMDNQLVVVGGGSCAVEVYLWNIVGECDELKDLL